MTHQEYISEQPFTFTGEDLDDLLGLLPKELRSHCRRVAICSSIMAEHADEMLYFYDMTPNNSFEMTVYLGGLCHDIGKLLNPDDGLPENRRLHPTAGASLLGRYRTTLFSNQTQAERVMEIVRAHHEKADGTGFPMGLKQLEIPFAATICAIANELDHDPSLGEGDTTASDAILEAFQQRKDTDFSKAALKCLKRAWPQLMERYRIWNGH